MDNGELGWIGLSFLAVILAVPACFVILPLLIGAIAAAVVALKRLVDKLLGHPPVGGSAVASYDLRDWLSKTGEFDQKTDSTDAARSV